MPNKANETVDVLLVGAGIMSSTLGTLIKLLAPELKVKLVELLDRGAAESSNPWNNAGTGHAGLCELNYTPIAADGSIPIDRAVAIHSMFEVSKQLWGHLVAQGGMDSPKKFINPVPHISFVRGEVGVAYLKKRYETMRQHHCFANMAYSEERATLAQWAPLLIPGRDPGEKIAATRVINGTDLNFGALTGKLLKHLIEQPDTTIDYNQKVVDLERTEAGWEVTLKDQDSGERRSLTARFVFLGAGGAALPLLQKSDIPESNGYGGFPVSGQWLRCDNPEVVAQHQAKVYSQAEVGAPPMSVPHLDTRVVDDGKSLLFGPYAGFSTKFLRHGSYLDLPKSIRLGNIGAMLAVARDNMDLTRYLVKEVSQSMEQRLQALRKFYPQAKAADWRLETAGQRVQIIKKDANGKGKLEFGTEIVTSADGSIAALLGASPGASVSVSAMLDVLARCLPEQFNSPQWRERLQTIFPASAKQLQNDPELYHRVRAQSDQQLELLPASY